MPNQKGGNKKQAGSRSRTSKGTRRNESQTKGRRTTEETTGDQMTGDQSGSNSENQ